MSKPKQMKLLAFLVILLCVVSCNNNPANIKVKNNDTAIVLNGRSQPDTVKYTCDSCESLGITKGVFQKVIYKATDYAKNSLKNPLSFVPLSINVQVLKEDSLFYFNTNKHIDSCLAFIIDYNCIGKNAYGVESQVKTSSVIYLVNDSIRDQMANEVKKPPLEIEPTNYIVSRQLFLDDINDDGYFSILPTLTKPYSLIVTASESCIDKGATLTIQFSDQTEITLKNWNDFNCKGIAYFDVSNADIELFRSKIIRYISFHDDDQIFASVPLNQSDYLMQYANLISLK